jgi:hypothetical protein
VLPGGRVATGLGVGVAAALGVGEADAFGDADAFGEAAGVALGLAAVRLRALLASSAPVPMRAPRRTNAAAEASGDGLALTEVPDEEAGDGLMLAPGLVVGGGATAEGVGVAAVGVGAGAGVVVLGVFGASSSTSRNSSLAVCSASLTTFWEF